MAKVKHIALIKFKPETSPEQVDKMFEDLMDLSENVPGIEDYVAGPNNSPEGRSDGYSHGFVMTFADATARDAYLTNPDHERFKAAFEPHVDKLAVIDFEV